MADPPNPFEAYRGDDDYVFVSYAHADAESVFPDSFISTMLDSTFGMTRESVQAVAGPPSWLRQ